MKKLLIPIFVMFLLVFTARADLTQNNIAWYPMEMWGADNECWGGNDWENGYGNGWLYISNEASCATTSTTTMGRHRGYDGTNYNLAVTNYDYGKQGFALTLNDGVTDEYVMFSDETVYSSSTEWTLMFWMNASDLSSNHDTLFEIENATDGESMRIYVYNTHIRGQFFWNSTDSVTPVMGGSLNEGTWYHLAYVCNGTDIKLYLNGDLNVTSPNWKDNELIHSNGGNVYLGTDLTTGSPTAGRMYHGRLDDMRYYQTALTESEISSIYNGGSGSHWRIVGEGYNLTSRYNFEERYYPYGTYGTTYDNAGWISRNLGGRYNDGLYLNGNQYVEIGDEHNIPTADFTISAWIKTTEDFGSIVHKQYGGNNGYLIKVNNGYFRGGFQETGTFYNIQTNELINTGSWVHVVMTVDRDSSTGIKAYINGEEATYSEQDNPSSVDGNSITTTDHLCIGATCNNAGATGTYFIGEIDEVLIWNRTLTTDEIYSVYVGNDLYYWNESSQNSDDWGEKIFTYTVKDITSGDYLNATVDSNYQTYLASREDFKTNTSNFEINFNESGINNYSLGIFPPSCLAETTYSCKTDGMIEYTAANYDTRQHYYDNADLSETTDITTLYLLEIALADDITITVEDNSGNPQEDVIMYIERYDVGQDNYIHVATGLTDQNGQDLIYLRKNDVWYRFKLYQDGGLVFTSDPIRIYQDTLTLTITQTSWDDWTTILDDVNASLTFNNATKVFSTSYATSSGLSRTVCMEVVEIRPGGNVNTLSDECQTAASGTISYTLTQDLYTYWAGVYTTTDGPKQYLLGLWHFSPDTEFAAVGLLIAIGILITCAAIGAANPIVGTILAIVAVFFMSPMITGLVLMGHAVTMGIVTLGVIIAIKIGRK